MIDIKFLRENPDVVKENIKKKFQDSKLPLVDEVIELDAEYRKALQRKEALQADKNKASKEIGGFMAKGMKDDAEAAKAKVKEYSEELAQLDKTVPEMAERIKTIMMTIPNIYSLHYLHKYYSEENLRLLHSQYLSCLILTVRYTLYSASVYL